MNRLLSSAANLLLVLVLGISLSGCVTTRLPVATSSPWKAQNLDTDEG
jgi:cytochrome c biogenesis protein ResB